MTIYGKDKFVAKSSEDVEAEPNELDAVTDDLGEDDELDEGVEVIDGEEEEDDAEEPASPLAEDAPPAKMRKPKDPATTIVDADEELENTPGVRTSGGVDVTAMSRTDRQREFPSVARPAGSRKKTRGPVRSRKRSSAPADRRRA
jgi:hypothetical protein